MSKTDIEIIPFSPMFSHHFKNINKEWIESMFEIEEVDTIVLDDPQTHIIDTGGQIWFAHHHKHGIVGTCALLRQREGVYELTKMGVFPKARGLKVGERLLRHVLTQVEEMDIQCLFLLTNKACQAAIHLYKKTGFVHCQEIMDEFGQEYARCDVAMKYNELPKAAASANQANGVARECKNQR